jgi:alkylation response protein AidB-like acyl-CoA dehydrogenase
MDVRFTDEQNLLRASARDFLAGECPMEFVREMLDHEHGFTDELWQKVCALGWPGLIIDDAYGGAGLGLVDLCVLLEQTGRWLLPGPFFSSVAVGAAAIAAGNAEQRGRWLPDLAAGRTRATLAQLETDGAWGREDIALAAVRDGAGFRLSGEKLYVPDAATADLMVVVAHDADAGGPTLIVVERETLGVTIEQLAYLDDTRRLSAVGFDDVSVEDTAVLGERGDGWRTLERLHDVARVAISAESIGGAAAVLDISVDYAKTREQFGTAIGRFQAIQHKCADMLVLIESSRSATYYAAWAVDNDEPDAHAAACMAKAHCTDAFSNVAGHGIQIHGGMGFTWEADLHLYYKRAQASRMAFGDPAWNRELAARALLDAD